MRISVVIPTLDEGARIGRCIALTRAVSGLDEIIVVDGGSSDGTVHAAAASPGIRTVQARRGRASQMNAGAQVASGDVLLFLHADVELPADAARWVRDALSDAGTVAGAFRTWTVAEQPTRWAPLLHLADLRSRYARLPYGDQALFVRAEVFHALGGFPEQPLMEDLELCRRLRHRGRIRVVPARVRVSGRRFQARPVYYTLLCNAFPLLYRMGVSPARLGRLYGNPR